MKDPLDSGSILHALRAHKISPDMLYFTILKRFFKRIQSLAWHFGCPSFGVHRIDVGEIVPVGYYDRDIGVWVPSDNGVVARLLDTDSDGVTDAIDTTGDGLPNDLNNDGDQRQLFFLFSDN